MGHAMDTILGGVTAPGATLTALTLASGDSLTVKNFDISKRAYILNTWVRELDTAGVFRIRSARLHDNVQGIRSRVPSALVFPILPDVVNQSLISQDTLIAELSGTATVGGIDSAVLEVWYDDLPGIAGRFITADEADKKTKNVVTVETAIVTGTTVGYGTARAFNADFDLLKANTDYALLGAFSDVRCTFISLRGPDTGNLRVSIPGELNIKHVETEWFLRLSRRSGFPTVPVISSANKAATFAEAFISQAGGTVNANFVLAELGA